MTASKLSIEELFQLLMKKLEEDSKGLCLPSWEKASKFRLKGLKHGDHDYEIEIRKC